MTSRRIRFLSLLSLLFAWAYAPHAIAAASWSVYSCGQGSSNIYSTYTDAFAHAQDFCNISGNWGFTPGSPVADTQGYHSTYRRYWIPNNSTDSTGTVTVTLYCSGSGITKHAGSPPYCDCPTGQAWNFSNGSCFTATCTSPSGSSGMFTGTSGSASSFCGNDYCGWAPVFSVSTSGGSWSGQFTSDGTVCTPATTQPTKTSGDTNCASSSTTTACLNNKTGCGTVNGVPTCIGTAPPGGCVVTASGNTFCVSTGSGTTIPPPVPTPPAPNTGTAGVAATPVATISTNGSVTSSGGVTGPSTTTVYSSAQTSASTVTSPNGSVSNNSGTGAAGSPDKTQSTCGSSGQPACQVTTCGGSGQPVCNSISGGADCSAPPACSGDPVLCYQSTQQWKTACALVGSNQTEIDGAINNAISSETGGLGLLNASNGTVVDVSGAISSGTPSSASLSDISIPLTGHFSSATVPMQNATELFRIVGFIVLITAHLVGIRTVMTG